MRKKKKFNISLLAYVLCAIMIIIIIPCVSDISGDVFRSKGRMSGYEEDSLYNDFIENNYEGLLENMLEELKELPKKAPDIMVYLKGSFETVMKRINLRGREFEIDESLKEYYHFLWKDYDNWVNNHYKASEVLIIDMDTMDVVNNEADKHKLIEMVEEKLKKVRNKNDGE